jgi:hypothetical protein
MPGSISRRQFLWYNLDIAVSGRRCVSMAKIIRISKEEAERRLGDVPDEKRFWCRDGRYIRNLKELAKALSDMSDEIFHHHSGDGGSDFSNWVRDVIGDNKLAGDLGKARSRVQASQAVAQRISFLESKL